MTRGNESVLLKVFDRNRKPILVFNSADITSNLLQLRRFNYVDSQQIEDSSTLVFETEDPAVVDYPAIQYGKAIYVQWGFMDDALNNVIIPGQKSQIRKIYIADRRVKYGNSGIEIQLDLLPKASWLILQASSQTINHHTNLKDLAEEVVGNTTVGKIKVEVNSDDNFTLFPPDNTRVEKGPDPIIYIQALKNPLKELRNKVTSLPSQHDLVAKGDTIQINKRNFKQAPKFNFTYKEEPGNFIEFIAETAIREYPVVDTEHYEFDAEAQLPVMTEVRGEDVPEDVLSTSTVNPEAPVDDSNAFTIDNVFEDVANAFVPDFGAFEFIFPELRSNSPIDNPTLKDGPLRAIDQYKEQGLNFRAEGGIVYTSNDDPEAGADSERTLTIPVSDETERDDSLHTAIVEELSAQADANYKRKRAELPKRIIKLRGEVQELLRQSSDKEDEIYNNVGIPNSPTSTKEIRNAARARKRAELEAILELLRAKKSEYESLQRELLTQTEAENLFGTPQPGAFKRNYSDVYRVMYGTHNTVANNDDPRNDFGTFARVDETRVQLRTFIFPSYPSSSSSTNPQEEINRKKNDLKKEQERRNPGTLTTLGEPSAISGCIIHIDSRTKTDSGNYFVLKVEHDVDGNSGYLTTWHVSRDGDNAPSKDKTTRKVKSNKRLNRGLKPVSSPNSRYIKKNKE